MKYINRHNCHRHVCSPVLWMLLLLLCLSACTSGDESAASSPNMTKLYVYVYAPQAAQPTRAAYDGNVSAITNEASVYSLQIWVYGHVSHTLLGHYSSTQPSSLTTSNPYELIQISIDDTYAETSAASRENVDVYVAANVKDSNCGQALDDQSTQEQLEAALIQKTTTDPFGMTTPVSRVPENVGLPMSGVLRDVPVEGDAPVLRLDDGNEGIATVQLIRTISKLRFAFSRQTGGETLRINSIRLNTEMLPIAEYIFMAAGAPYDRHTCHIKTESGYDATTPDLLGEAITEIAESDNPTYYAWDQQLPPLDYEQRMEDGVAAGKLTQRYFYLRESDKLIQGEIKYQVGSGEEQTATFNMVDVGGFSRNHVWTVYAYQAEASLKLIVAEVAPWVQKEEDYEFYNW